MKKHKWFWLTLLALALISPIGLLANGTAWGEWGKNEIGQVAGFVPAGLAKLSGWYKALMPDYNVRGWEGFTKSAVGYIMSALLGIALISGIVFVVTKAATRSEKPSA
jgi:hypothetical protein